MATRNFGLGKSLTYLNDDGLINFASGSDIVLTPDSDTGIISTAVTVAGQSATAVNNYSAIDSLPLSNLTSGSLAYVQSTGTFYYSNGSGWYKITTTNSAPIIVSGADASYQLATDGSSTIISLSASDSDGTPLTWSYSITGGTLGNAATITQDSSVFTITPSTDSADASSFDITFSVTDGFAIATDTASFTLSFIVELAVDYLVIAGGGGGAGGASNVGGGGGGAGGLLESTATMNAGSTYTITVGTGGSGGGPAVAGISGTNSEITGDNVSVTAIGGGNGGFWPEGVGDGGSGGGYSGDGVTFPGPVGQGTPGQGYNGSVGGGSLTITQCSGGGGGGAGGAASGSTGGVGASSSITGTAVTYASGGNGAQPNYQLDANSTVGGGGRGGSTSVNGDAGNDGVVILRSLNVAASTTGSPTVTADGLYTVYTFTQNGTITF